MTAHAPRTCAFCDAVATTKIQNYVSGIPLAPIWTCGSYSCGGTVRRKVKAKRQYATENFKKTTL